MNFALISQKSGTSVMIEKKLIFKASPVVREGNPEDSFVLYHPLPVIKHLKRLLRGGKLDRVSRRELRGLNDLLQELHIKMVSKQISDTKAQFPEILSKLLWYQCHSSLDKLHMDI